MSAQKNLEQFKQSQEVGGWSKVSKLHLIKDMELLIKNPVMINQSSTPLCGPAAIVYELVRKHPQRYVRMMQNLFERGAFEAGGKTISASNDLRGSPVSSGMSPADWMLMATMRECENFLFDELDDGSWDIELGITTPWEMKGWARTILGFGRVDFESTVLYGEFDAMRSADKVVRNRGVAFLLVHSALMDNDAPVFDHPDHWVTYTGGLQITEGTEWDKGHIVFQCQTWGEIRHISVGEGKFEDSMWGVVIAI